MELVLLIGLQATGKSFFCRERFYRTHLRINLDMLKTRPREWALVRACLLTKTRLVVDNTNLSREDRARYILPAREAGYCVIGYFFESTVSDALRRNADRAKPESVPAVAIAAAGKKLELPGLEEGFDQLHRVRLNGDNHFTVEKWNP